MICIEDIREENPNKDSIILEYHADLHCVFPFLCFACFPVTVTKTINIKKRLTNNWSATFYEDC